MKRLLYAAAALLCFCTLSGQDPKGFGKPGDPSDLLSVEVHEYRATFTNTSDEKIIGICGVFMTEDELGRRNETRFMTNLTGPFISPDHCLDPGESRGFGPKRYKGYSDRYVPLNGFEVTGVVTMRGNYIGTDGRFCKSRIFDNARAAHMQLVEVRRLADRRDFSTMEASFKSVAPFVRGHDSEAVHIWIQHLVLDKNNALRKDYKDRLDLVIARIRDF